MLQILRNTAPIATVAIDEETAVVTFELNPDITYPVAAGLTPVNKRFIEGGHLIEAATTTDIELSRK